jgi:Domain of unknown function (DUF1508).
MPAIFKVFETDNQYSFHYVNSEGDVLLTSPSFANKEDAESAIQAVRVGSLMSQQIGKSSTPEGEHFFMISDTSGMPVARSVPFSNEMVFNNALHNVRSDACTAEVTYD